MAITKLVVEVCEGCNLMPKDGQGSSSPYMQVNFDGRQARTQIKFKQLNPVWNETFEIALTSPSEMEIESLEMNVYNNKHLKRSKFLGE